MTTPDPSFHESGPRSTPIRELGLSLDGSTLEPILEEFLGELRGVGITRVVPRFYLSTEWGVPEGTIAIAIPFYLAKPELVDVQIERQGYVEGTSPADILRYLRHEMGHVINYAYRLHEVGEWSDRFGEMDDPYPEEYRPEPFSRRFVRHLPGWYAQKHPDEDWAETFAVWMTPGLDWRTEYAAWPVALEKLQYCDFTMAWLVDRDPVTIEWTTSNEDVGVIDYSVDDHYPQPGRGRRAQRVSRPRRRAPLDLRGPGSARAQPGRGPPWPSFGVVSQDRARADRRHLPLDRVVP